MPENNLPELLATDLPLTLYLNQQFAFDLLAMLNHGLSQFSTVKTVSTEETMANSNRNAQLGVSNVFVLLGINLSAESSKQDGQKLNENKTEEIVHTPASLFALLRKDLKSRDLVHFLQPSENLDNLQSNTFVEFAPIHSKFAKWLILPA